MSELYGFALKEDQKQKIRELDFGTNSSQQQTIAHCDINAIKGSGCYKCGGNDHFIKDSPQNRDNSKSYNGPSNVHQKQYNSYKDQNKSGDNDSLEKSIQTMTDLLKTFIKKTSQSHSTYYKPSQKYPANRNSDQRQSYRNSNQNPHNRGHHHHHRNNTRINEIGEFHSDYTSSCSDQSDVEEEFDTQEPPTSENSKKLDYPSQQNHSLPEPFRGNKTNNSKIRHIPIQNNSNDDKTSIEIQSNRDISPVNIHILPETEIVHLGQRSKDECSLLFKLVKELTKHCGTQEHANVYYHLKVTI